MKNGKVVRVVKIKSKREYIPNSSFLEKVVKTLYESFFDNKNQQYPREHIDLEFIGDDGLTYRGTFLLFSEPEEGDILHLKKATLFSNIKCINDGMKYKVRF
jgi:hypothetical protein